MLRKFTYILFLLCCINTSVFAQEIYNNLKKGIQLLEQENYPDAEASFKKIIEKNDTIKEAYFNLGNAVYGQERFEEARENYNKALSFFEDKKDLAETYHNIGNTFMAEKEWKKSIESFKSALKNNPSDMDTKYNLAYAQKMLEKQKQQEQQNQDNEDKKDDKQEKDEDKKDDQQDKDKKEDDEGDKKEDDKKNEEKEEKKDGEKDDKEKEEDTEKDKQEKGDEEKKEEAEQGQPEEMKLSKEEAERLLRAIEMQEQKLQDKKKQEDMTPVRINTEKDW